MSLARHMFQKPLQELLQEESENPQHNTREPAMYADVPIPISTIPAPPQQDRGLRSRLRIAALVASSAFLGGIAVVVWHRRALEQMRKTEPGSASPINPDEFV